MEAPVFRPLTPIATHLENSVERISKSASKRPTSNQRSRKGRKIDDIMLGQIYGAGQGGFRRLIGKDMKDWGPLQVASDKAIKRDIVRKELKKYTQEGRSKDVKELEAEAEFHANTNEGDEAGFNAKLLKMKHTFGLGYDKLQLGEVKKVDMEKRKYFDLFDFRKELKGTLV